MDLQWMSGNRYPGEPRGRHPRGSRREMNMLLENKSVVIYGAGGAIGSAVSRAFAREGADLYIAGRTVASVRALADEVSVMGVTAEAAEVDALDEAAVQRHLDDVAGRTHAIDVLFDAIGMDDVQGTLLVDMPVEHFVQPTFKAMRTKFVTARTAARKMAQRGSGVIMSVTVPPTPMLHNGGFGVACAAVEALWRSLALELGPRGVRFIILRSAGSPDSPGSERRSSVTLRPSVSPRTISSATSLGARCSGGFRRCRRSPRPPRSWRPTGRAR
jgi:3-oxoacyl-[acyl-carrier protein] reductase